MLTRQFIRLGLGIPFLTSPFLSLASELRPEKRAIHPFVLSPSQYPVLELRGTPSERGETYGKGTKELIERNIRFYGALFQTRNVDWEKAKRISKKFLPFIEKYSPDSIKEMEGIAKGAGLSFEDILVLNCRSEILFASDDGCTCVSLLGEWGKDGHVFLGQTWDWVKEARENTCILKIHQENRPSILMVAEAGVVGGKGLNSEGLGIGLNAMSIGRGKPGVPLHIMMRNVLNSTNCNEAISCVSMVPRAGSGAFNIVSSDNYAFVIEFSPDEFDVLMSELGPLAHTNHYLSPLIAPQDKGKAPVASTYTRLNDVRRRLFRHDGKFDAFGILDLLVSHQDFPDSICAHEDFRDKGMHFCTVYSMVLDVTAKKMWVTNGYPCEGSVTEYSL